MNLPEFVKQAAERHYPYRFSVCTLVTRREEYAEMFDSFVEAGFDTQTCEYLMIDNSVTNQMDAYQGFNYFLRQSQGQYVIICHQDILLIKESTKAILEQRITQIDELDSRWAVLSNAGSVNSLTNRNTYKVGYPAGKVEIKGSFPQSVSSVDENFILVKHSANLSVSADLRGYHLYGLDLCLIARLLGYTCYVIDFLLIHKSKGNADASFDDARHAIQNKYTGFMKGRYVNTTITSFYLSGSKFWNKFYQTKLLRRITKIIERL